MAAALTQSYLLLGEDHLDLKDKHVTVASPTNLVMTGVIRGNGVTSNPSNGSILSSQRCRKDLGDESLKSAISAVGNGDGSILFINSEALSNGKWSKSGPVSIAHEALKREEEYSLASSNLSAGIGTVPCVSSRLANEDLPVSSSRLVENPSSLKQNSEDSLINTKNLHLQEKNHLSCREESSVPDNLNFDNSDLLTESNIPSKANEIASPIQFSLKADISTHENLPLADAKSDKAHSEEAEISSSVGKTRADPPLVIYKWTNIIAISIVHLLAVYGIGYMAWNWSTLTILFSFLTGGLSGFGVTGGAHRLWTHRSYKARTPLQVILLFCYTLAGQNTVYEWVRDHRVHHKYSETDADPHNSNRGFFFSHVGWLLTRKHPSVLDRGSKIDMSDITSDPLLEWHRRHFFWLRMAVCYFLPVWLPMVLWNETFTYAFLSNAVRYAMSLNATWSVNSFAHIWGYKPYDRRIKPVENWGVAIFAMGEGWHNYHHAFPWDYRASEMGYRYNLTTYLIDQFAKLGWAYDLKTPSENLVATMAAKYGEVPRPPQATKQKTL